VIRRIPIADLSPSAYGNAQRPDDGSGGVTAIATAAGSWPKARALSGIARLEEPLQKHWRDRAEKHRNHEHEPDGQRALVLTLALAWVWLSVVSFMRLHWPSALSRRSYHAMGKSDAARLTVRYDAGSRCSGRDRLHRPWRWSEPAQAHPRLAGSLKHSPKKVAPSGR
jgi:hypothetical protein